MLIGRRSLVAALVLLMVPAFVAACDGGDAGRNDTTSSTAGQAGNADTEVSGDVLVFAAASLTDVLAGIADTFEDANPDASVEFNFAGSSALAAQIVEGAPADVFISANKSQMDKVNDAGAVEDVRPLVTNELVVVVPAGSDAVQSFEDLATDGVRLVLAAENVPAGQYAREALGKADASGEFGDRFAERVLTNVVSEEPDVRTTLTRVQLGEADAGIVYRTDALAAGDDVDVIEIPADVDVLAEYFVAVAKDSGNHDAAEAWLDYITGPDAREALERAGFSVPDDER
jgi:molybdate transport system substrate-binding protein